VRWWLRLIQINSGWFMNKFWKFMDSAKGFWSLIAVTIITGIIYMVGSKKMIDELMKRRDR
jgi:hypothetical protein